LLQKLLLPQLLLAFHFVLLLLTDRVELVLALGLLLLLLALRLLTRHLVVARNLELALLLHCQRRRHFTLSF